MTNDIASHGCPVNMRRDVFFLRLVGSGKISRTILRRQVRKESWLVGSFFLKYLKSWFFSDSVEFSKKADENRSVLGI